MRFDLGQNRFQNAIELFEFTSYAISFWIEATDKQIESDPLSDNRRKSSGIGKS